MTVPIVRFDAVQLIEAFNMGLVRTNRSRGRGMKDAHGLVVRNNEHDLAVNARRETIGVLGEWAVANYFGREYECTVDSFKEPDIVIGEWGLQVKASEKGEFFIIRQDAQNHEPYIYCHVILPPSPFDPRRYASDLAVYAECRVYIKGWMFPYEAREMALKNPGLIRDPGNRNSPAIFIPVDQIHPVRQLREMVLA